jgi:hypothetical protein
MSDVTRLPRRARDEDAEQDFALAGAPDEEQQGRSLEQLADEESEAELFPQGSLAGDDLTPQKLIKRGLPTEVTVSIGKAEVPMPAGGLMDPGKSGRVLVSYAFFKNEEVAQRENGDIVGWKIRQHLKATYVQQANDEAALIRSEFDALIALDEAAAGRLLDDLTRRFRDER